MTLLRALPAPVVLKDILLFTIFDIAKFLVLCGKLLPSIALIASFFALRNALGLVDESLKWVGACNALSKVSCPHSTYYLCNTRSEKYLPIPIMDLLGKIDITLYVPLSQDDTIMQSSKISSA